MIIILLIKNKNKWLWINSLYYTNEKINGPKITDLLLSIEHPLSSLEIPEGNKDKILNLHLKEIDLFYDGDINEFQFYKRLIPVNMNFKNLL